MDVDTDCDATLCEMNEHVVSNACVTCTTGTTNTEGNDASGVDTDCNAVLCEMNEHVVSNECVPCIAGTTNAVGDDAALEFDTECNATLCEINEHVVANECVACTAETTNTEGNDASGVDTDCITAITSGARGPTFERHPQRDWRVGSDCICLLDLKQHPQRWRVLFLERCADKSFRLLVGPAPN
jgi:hypothetical protein